MSVGIRALTGASIGIFGLIEVRTCSLNLFRMLCQVEDAMPALMKELGVDDYTTFDPWKYWHLDLVPTKFKLPVESTTLATLLAGIFIGFVLNTLLSEKAKVE